MHRILLRLQFLLFFIIFGTTSDAQNFIKVLPSPNYSQAFAAAEDGNFHGIIACSISVSSDLSSHLTNNFLKIYKLNFQDNSITDSLEIFPPAGMGISQVVNISENFPSPNRFILSGSYNGLSADTKNPFFILIDSDLNILNQTIAGLPNKREALYQDIIVNDSTILYHGCVISDSTDDCSMMYQVTLNSEGEILEETTLEDSESLLNTSFITQLSESFVAQDGFDNRFVFFDTETSALEIILEDPYQQSAGVPIIFRAGNRGSLSHPTEENRFITPGQFSWLNAEFEEENHHGFYIFSDEGEIIDSLILQGSYQTGYDFDNLISDDEGNLIILAQSAETTFGYGDFYILQKITLTGEIIWEQLISLPDNQKFILYTIEPISDGGLLLIGSVLTDEGINGNRDALLIKVNPQDNISSLHPTGKKPSLFLYPNPAQNHLFVNGLPEGSFTFNIYNLQGSLIGKGELSENNPVDIRSLSDGNYILSLSQSNSNSKINLKFTVTRGK